MRYNGLRFFNGTQTEIELKYNSTDEIFEGSIHLDEVSTGLYETATLFILEEAVNQYGAPVMVKPIGSQIGSEFELRFIKDKISSKDINLIKPVLSTDGEMYVKIQDSVELTPQSISVATSTTDGIHTLGSTYSSEALETIVALNSEDDKAHYRYLQIIDTVDNHIIASIYVYGETVGEDERLAVLLSNFGTSVSSKDQFIFKDHDINELGNDWLLINQKRKELLLELSNIKPFIGTYKALINAIKFYGYNNLTLKEYWLMIDDRSPMFGKMKAVEVPDSSRGFVSKKINVNLPQASYKKSSRFGLFYKINTPTGEFDEWDIPEVEEVFEFTPDEVLIKLYGLKNKLQKDYLPLQAKIVDIIGEGDFFAAYNTNIWNNQNTISDFSGGVEPSIIIHNEDPFIEDLSKISSLYTGIGQDFSNLSVSDMETLYNTTEEFYLNYYDLDRTSYDVETSDDAIGAPVLLECDSFPDTWDEATFNWLDTEEFITWNNWWKKNIYELRWYITGPNAYSQTIIGGVDDVRKIVVSLPYKGLYTVVFEQVDLFNNVSVLRYPDSIEVKMKQLEIYGVYRWKDQQSYQWNGSRFNWGKAGGDWDFPQQNKDTVDQEVGTMYLTLDRSNYLHDQSKGINFSMVRRFADSSNPSGYAETTGPYFWRNLNKHTWNDGKHTWWDATRVGADVTSSFKIASADPFSVLTVTYYDLDTEQSIVGTYEFPVALTDPFDIASWIQVADELNNSTDPVLSKFNYNPILEDTTGNGTPDECRYILCVGKQYSRVYDFESVEILVGPGTIEGRTNYNTYNPTYNDLQILESWGEVELLTHLTFSADKSMMPGKRSYNWKLVNNSREVSDIVYSEKWFTYLFEHKGDYTIELQVTDINGNTNIASKNALSIKSFPGDPGKGTGPKITSNMNLTVPAPNPLSGTSGTSGTIGTSGTSGTSGSNLILNLRTI